MRSSAAQPAPPPEKRARELLTQGHQEADAMIWIVKVVRRRGDNPVDLRRGTG
jgi:hypothetical protein